MSNHFDADGHPRMVDISDKPTTQRSAIAESHVVMTVETASKIRAGDFRKGDVLAVARLAAIMATKHTSLLIPLCHPIPVEGVEVSFDWLPNESDSTVAWLRCRVVVRTSGRTGVEMEALTAASVAALTVYDMCKSVERGMEIGPTRLLEKAGGKSGHFVRAEFA